MNIFKLLIVMVVVASISACSKAPSESDAKKVVLSMLGDCSHISLEHFEKTNGTPIGEQGYKVDIAYSVKLKPIPEIQKMLSPELAAAYARMKNLEPGGLDQWYAIQKPIEDALKGKLATECPNMDLSFYKRFIGSENDLSKFSQDYVKEFSGTIPMVKTDNGWQAAQ